VVDYGAIEERIRADSLLFDVKEIAYDPWNATHIALRLQDEGATMVEFRQGFRSMAAPTRELEKLIVSRKLAHGANPVTCWMASNVAVAQDPAGNLKPAKDKSTERIDGIVAIIMAIGRAMLPEEPARRPTRCSSWDSKAVPHEAGQPCANPLPRCLEVNSTSSEPLHDCHVAPALVAIQPSAAMILPIRSMLPRASRCSRPGHSTRSRIWSVRAISA
jgi:hypothetical protein